MNREKLKAEWLRTEREAKIVGWDFSPIEGRCVETPLPWDYAEIVKAQLSPDREILDYDTGGGEFLLSLGHPYGKTAATEGYPPNVALCRERLAPLGIRFAECADASHIPFPDGSFDLILNRHGDFDPKEIHRLLKSGGRFLTQQVGDENDRDLVERVLPGLPLPYPGLNLTQQRKAFEDAGFRILRGEEAFLPITFTDVAAFVWFARIIEWEFPGFSVEACFDALLSLQQEIEEKGSFSGAIHRYLIEAERI